MGDRNGPGREECFITAVLRIVGTYDNKEQFVLLLFLNRLQTMHAPPLTSVAYTWGRRLPPTPTLIRQGYTGLLF